MNEPLDISSLCLDDQFVILLHKKIMDKKGSAKRRAKKYYMDQYKKTGVIPKPLLLAGRGIMEGRKCSGRKAALSDDVKRRFIEIFKASCDPEDPSFIFIQTSLYSAFLRVIFWTLSFFKSVAGQLQSGVFFRSEYMRLTHSVFCKVVPALFDGSVAVEVPIGQRLCPLQI